MFRINVKRRHKEHPWIFSNEITEKQNILPGEIVEVYQGHICLGRGFYNSRSLIAVRLFSKAAQEFNQQFVNSMVDKALAFRNKITKEKSFRLIYSESDGLPGLIIDKYEDNFVIQMNCYGMDLRRDMVIESLARMKPGFVYERSDNQLRKLEGLDSIQGLIFGTLHKPVLIRQDGMLFIVDIEKGQKTGFYFDLADIRRKVKNISNDRDVLDLFCYSGSFSIYAAHGGAATITGVDSSDPAIALAEENCRRNSIQNARFVCADAFDFLRSDKKRYDLVIVDPPSFTKSKKSLAAARRGYKEINLQAMKHLNRNGILVTTSCSYHVSAKDFQEIVRESAIDAGLQMRITGRVSQSLDHPILLNMLETNYLKCLILERVD